jgi:apolipoprotein N-acyltransferase
MCELTLTFGLSDVPPGLATGGRVTLTTTSTPAVEPAGPADTTPEPGSVLLGLAVAAGTPVLVLLANPPLGVWPLIFVAFVPMLMAQHRLLPRRWSWLAPAVGIGGAYAVYFSPGLADGDVAFVYQLFPLYVAVLAVLATGRSRAFNERTDYRWIAVSAPVAWTAIDFVRSSGSETLGGTWGFHAYAMYAHPALLQPSSIFGITGLQLLILLTSWAVAGVVLRGRAGIPAAVVVAGLLAGWAATSVMLLDDAPPTVRVAAVQNGLPNDEEWGGERLERYVAQSRDAAEQGARLIVWSEAGLTFDPQQEHTDELRSLAAETDAYLVLGYRIEESDGRIRNATTVLAPDGTFLGVYGKDHPGAFAGDYNDFQGDFPVYDTEIGALATIICYDLDYTDTARIMTRGGARLIAAPSSDVSAIAETHYTHLVFRAIENRVSMVKADSRYDSAIIDPWGRIITSVSDSSGDTQATLVADVPLGGGDSPWVRYGNWFGWIAVAVAAGFVVVSVTSRRRPKREVNGR